MFFEQFNKLCIEENTTPTKFVTDILHMSSSKVTAWKNGSIPKYEILNLIANHFNTTIGSLFDGAEKTSPIDDLSENELEMLEVFQKFNDREQLKLIGKLEELYRQKQIKENQQSAAFKVARSSDGQFRKTELSAEELERIHNLPIDTDY